MQVLYARMSFPRQPSGDVTSKYRERHHSARVGNEDYPTDFLVRPTLKRSRATQSIVQMQLLRTLHLNRTNRIVCTRDVVNPSVPKAVAHAPLTYTFPGKHGTWCEEYHLD